MSTDARRDDESRVCAAEGCNEPLDHLRSDARYHSGACRTAAYRQRSLDAREKRRKASRRRHRTPDLRISYRRLIPFVAELLTQQYAQPAPDHVAAGWARDELNKLLTERQRAAVEEREART